MATSFPARINLSGWRRNHFIVLFSGQQQAIIKPKMSELCTLNEGKKNDPCILAIRQHLPAFGPGNSHRLLVCPNFGSSLKNTTQQRLNMNLNL